MHSTKRFDNKEDIIKHVAKNYNALNYIPKLQELLTLIYPNECFSETCKFELHRRINNKILKAYPGESCIKYSLFQEFRRKNLIAAFEMNVNSSRLDFITINGVSTSYEIKSSLDTLHKLSKQSADYLQAFEFNNIVVDVRHLDNAMKIVPDHFGIYTFHRGKRKLIRKGVFNFSIDSKFQLGLLTKKEINKSFGKMSVPEICNTIDPVTINSKFKLALKERYKERWQFVTKRAEQILPLDIQFFFNSNVDPQCIYG